MVSKKKIPAEAVDLYTRFIHGEMTRRDFLAGVQKFHNGDRQSLDALARPCGHGFDVVARSPVELQAVPDPLQSAGC